MLIFAMTVSMDGFVADREGSIGFSAPDDELFAHHLERVSGLSGYLLGRRLYEMMLPWETDPAMRSSEAYNAFADAWCALPKVVFTRTLTTVVGDNARLAQASLAEEIAAARTETQDVEIGGPDLAGQATELGLLDEWHCFRAPVILGGGKPYVSPVSGPVPLELIETRRFGSIVSFERYRRSMSSTR